MAMAPVLRKTFSAVPPQRRAIVANPALAAASMSKRVSPTVTASSVPSISKMKARGLGRMIDCSFVDIEKD